MSTPWQSIETAPKDGTLLFLLCAPEPETHFGTPTEDAVTFRTIGFNNLDHDGENKWLLAGWNWEHDCFTEGMGIPIRWMPMPAKPPEFQEEGDE